MNVGEYWAASSVEADDKSMWLFLLVATTTVNRRRYFLGVKCCWEGRKPEWEPSSFCEYGYTGAWWFSSDGRCTDGSAPFELDYRTVWTSKKFLNAPIKRG